MKVLNLRQFASGSIAAAALLAGCGESSVAPAVGIPARGASLLAPQLAQGDEMGVGGARQRSWVAREAQSEDLLYVTNYSYITVYTYPQGKLVGYLQGFQSSVGECVDKNQNIYITNHVYKHGSVRIAEYAHGGTKPVALLEPTHVGAVGCSVDPTTGDLAVSGSSGVPGVDIFTRARGKPVFHKVPFVEFTQFCGYDSEGNLFVNGLKDSKHDYPFALLRKGSSKFVNVNLGVAINDEGGVQWDGKHLAVAAYILHRKHGRSIPLIDQFTFSGTRATEVGSTILGSPAYITLQFFISNDTVIVPNWYYDSSQPKNVLFYNYPQGGSPTTELDKHSSDPRGVAVSLHS